MTVEMEQGFFNFETREISLPRLGFQAEVETELLEFSHISADFGRIYWTVEKEKNSGFRMVGNDFTARLFEDKTR